MDPWGEAPASGHKCATCGRLVTGADCEICGGAAPSAGVSSSASAREETETIHVASSPVELHDEASSLPPPPPSPPPRSSLPETQPQPQPNSRPPSPPPAVTREPRARHLPDAWVCASCTLENEGTAAACGACDFPRGGAAEAPPKDAAAWTCSTCSCRTNAAHDATCGMCSEPRRRGNGGGGNSAAERRAAERRGAPPRPQPRTPPPSWKCTYCDFKNEDFAEQACLVCTGARPNSAGGGGGGGSGGSYASRPRAPAAVQKAREYWACGRCTFLNEAGSYVCETCGGPP